MPISQSWKGPTISLEGNNTSFEEIAESLAAESRERPSRLKTWDLAPMLHCSIVGTCLTASELRSVMAKVGDPDIKSASDHVLHSRGVQAAGQRNIAGKLLNKALDKRHERIVKRFSAMKTIDAIRVQWNLAVEDGEIAGAYWAVLSHPVSDRQLINDVFGEVHMLSHLVGSASRLDLARLEKLQADVEDKDQKLDRQERRLASAAHDNRVLQHQISELEDRLMKAEALANVCGAMSDKPPLQSASESVYKDRTELLTDRLKAAETRVREAEAALEQATSHATLLQAENDILEGFLAGDVGRKMSVDCKGGIGTLLYVGGRRNLFDHLRTIATDHGITLLLHDGGLEDNTTLLPSMIGQSQAVLFPVDHVSHTAASLLKRICRENSKPYVPLRSAGLGSFLAAVRGVALADAV